MGDKTLSYRIHCLLPADRVLCLTDSKILTTREETDDDIEADNAASIVEIPIYLKHSGGAVEMMTRDNVGLALGFLYTPRICFLHEKSFRGILTCEVGQNPSELCLDEVKIRTLLNKPFYEMVSIRYVSDTVGYGLFAEEILHAGDMLGEYTGMVLDISTSFNTYSLLFPSTDGNYQIDSSEYGNETRFINHSSNPNCEYVHVVVDGLCHVICVVKRDVRAGEQITVDYGKGYWEKLKTISNILPVDNDQNHQDDHENTDPTPVEEEISCHLLCSLTPMFLLTCMMAACY